MNTIIHNIFDKLKKVIKNESPLTDTNQVPNEEKQELQIKDNFLPEEFIMNNLAKVLPIGTFMVIDDKRNIFVSNYQGQEIYYGVNNVKAITESDSGKKIYQIVQNTQLNEMILPSKKESTIWGTICPSSITEDIEKIIEVEKEMIVENPIPIKKEIFITKENDVGRDKLLDKYREIEEMSMPIVYSKDYVEDNLAEIVDVLLNKSGLGSSLSSSSKYNNRNIRAYLRNLTNVEVINPELKDTTIYAVFCESYATYSFRVFRGNENEMFLQINPNDKLIGSKLLNYIENNGISKKNSLVFVSLQNKNGVEHLIIHNLISLLLGGKVDYLII